MSHPDFQASCPAGGDWYACGNASKFAGCCSIYPCTQNGCPQGQLHPASFDSSHYGKLPDQECSAGQFYTCGLTDPPFLGCCTVSPCTDGCPAGDLQSVFLSNDDFTAQAFDPVPPLAGYSVSSPTPNPSAPKSTPTGAIVGGTIAGVAFLLALCALFFFLFRRHRRSRNGHNMAPSNQVSPLTAQHTPYTDVTTPSMVNRDEKRDVYVNTPAEPQELPLTERPPMELEGNTPQPPAYRSPEMGEAGAQVGQGGQGGTQVAGWAANAPRVIEGEGDGLGIRGRDG